MTRCGLDGGEILTHLRPLLKAGVARFARSAISEIRLALLGGTGNRRACLPVRHGLKEKRHGRAGARPSKKSTEFRRRS